MNGEKYKFPTDITLVKFLADHMLGKLARYLRFMGYDTYYPDGGMSDDEIIALAGEENRVILTRDKELAARSGGYFVRSDDYREQLRDVVSHFQLGCEAMLSRCSLCNTPLVRVSREAVRGRVPQYVYEHTEEFYMCPTCKRIYWYGTHTERIERFLTGLLGEEHED